MKYDILYFDPPWSFKVWSDKGKDRSAEQHYNVMTIEDIKALDINSLASDNSVLLLWVTYPLLKEGIETLEAWGFSYKTVAFTWAKTCVKSHDKFFMGNGYYTRANAEICLLGTKGKPLPVLSHSVRQLVVEPIRKHSEKPDSVRDSIVELFGDRPRLEGFGRKLVDGWTVIGNEVTGNDITLDIERLKNE